MKILTIDGGGVFGIVPAYFSAKIDMSQFDCFAGTSVGSILALSYASELHPVFIFDLFKVAVKDIFSEKKLNFLKGSKFKDHNLNRFLQQILSHDLGDVKKPIFVPAYNICKNQPKIFDNIAKTPDITFPAWEIARSSCAAPTYFTPWNGYIDGGVVANNPSMIAIWGLMDKLKISLPEMEVLSIGTGWMPPANWNASKIENWWIWQWLSPILQLVTDGNEIMFHFGCKQIPLKKYVRFDEIKLPKNADFTDPKFVPEVLMECKKNEFAFMKAYEKFMED